MRKSLFIFFTLFNCILLNAMEKETFSENKGERSNSLKRNLSHESLELQEKYQKLCEELSPNTEFVGSIPEKLQNILRNIDNEKAYLFIELYGPHKSGKTLLVDYFAQKINADRLIVDEEAFNAGVIRSSEKNPDIGAAFDEQLGESNPIQQFKRSQNKFFVFCFKHFDEIIKQAGQYEKGITELTKSIISGMVESDISEDNADEESKKIIFVSTSKIPILNEVIKKTYQHSFSDRVIQSIEIKNPGQEDRKALFEKFIKMQNPSLSIEKKEIEKFARKTDKFSAYDILQVIKNSSLNKKEKNIQPCDITNSIDDYKNNNEDLKEVAIPSYFS